MYALRGVALWSAVVLAAMVLIVFGLERSLLWTSTPQLRQEARLGHLFVLSGSALLLAAALWSYLRRRLLLGFLLVAAPAVLLGGLVLAAPYSLYAHIAALFALPAAIVGVLQNVKSMQLDKTTGA